MLQLSRPVYPIPSGNATNFFNELFPVNIYYYDLHFLLDLPWYMLLIIVDISSLLFNLFDRDPTEFPKVANDPFKLSYGVLLFSCIVAGDFSLTPLPPPQMLLNIRDGTTWDPQVYSDPRTCKLTLHNMITNKDGDVQDSDSTTVEPL